MAVEKLSSTDGFVVKDFPDAPSAGLVRVGKKILQASATDLARSATYTFAAFGLERGGASAGLNANGDAVTEATAALVAELGPQVADGRLCLTAGKGADPKALESLSDVDPAAYGTAMVGGLVAAAGFAFDGGLAGRRVAIEQTAAASAPVGLVEALGEAGAEVVEIDGVEEKPWLIWGAEVDAVFAGSKPGALTHQGAEQFAASVLVPWAPIPLTTKALAVLLRRDVRYIPDFVSASGGLLLVSGVQAETIPERVGAALSNASSTDKPLFLACAEAAESFLRTWRDALPFGRPLAA